jgi:hypothetical protein
MVSTEGISFDTVGTNVEIFINFNHNGIDCSTAIWVTVSVDMTNATQQGTYHHLTYTGLAESFENKTLRLDVQRLDHHHHYDDKPCDQYRIP